MGKVKNKTIYFVEQEKFIGNKYDKRSDAVESAKRAAEANPGKRYYIASAVEYYVTEKKLKRRYNTAEETPLTDEQLKDAVTIHPPKAIVDLSTPTPFQSISDRFKALKDPKE